MATALDVITGTFNTYAIFQPNDDIPPADPQAALAGLNDYLNGLNARGAVFENVNLALTDPVPVADQNLGDLKMALGRYIGGQWGKTLSGDDLAEAVRAENRFIAANTVVYPAVTDAGLKRMPSTRRFWTGS